ncbi:25113_t:CDS:2, partial [Gigaspora rosea]
NRAHKMPLAVSNWINNLEVAQQNISAYFNKELQEAYAILEPIEYKFFEDQKDQHLQFAFLSAFFPVEVQEQLFDDIIEFKNNLEQNIQKEIEVILGLREALE